MHYIEEHIAMYVCERIRTMKSSNEGALDWNVVRDICKFCLYDKDGCRKDPQEMIHELDFLLDIRDHVLRQRSRDAAHETSTDLTREEVGRCYYMWKVDFLETRLWPDQDHYKPPKWFDSGLQKQNHSSEL